MLSLIHFNVFIMSGPFFLQARLQHLGDLYPLWAERCLYCNLTPWCCYSSQFEDECWGLPVSVHRHPKVGKLCLNTYMQPFFFRQQKARGEGRVKRGDWEQGHTIHASLLGSKEFSQLWHSRTAPGYLFCDVKVLYWNNIIALWRNRTVSGYCPVT